MPVPPPKKGETQSEFMHRCVPQEIGTGENKRPQDQAVAICLDMWRREHGGEKPKSDREELAEIIEGIAAILAKYSGDQVKWPTGHRFCPKCGYAWTVDVHKPKGE